jgi:ATP-binding cassette subfamily C protein/ATP-binding cassette subfamily C protein EexD
MQHGQTPLLRAIKSCCPALVASFVLSIFVNASMLVLPIYSMQLYDRVLTSRNYGTLLLLTLIVGAFLALYGVLEFVRSGVLARAAMQFEATLRCPLFETMMRAELSPSCRMGQQAIRDADTIRDCLSTGTVATMCDLPWAPLFVGLCFIQHVLLGFVALIGACVLLLVAISTELATRTKVDHGNRLAAEANRFVAAVLRNSEVVRGLGMGDVVLNRWSGAQSAALAAHGSAIERHAALHAFAKFARLAVQTSLLCAGAWLAIDRAISPGTMLAASIIMTRALAPLEQAIGQWKRIVALRAACARLEGLFRAIPVETAPTPLPPPRGRLELENVVVCPPAADLPAVKGVSLVLHPGESLAIVGASGSGKSSLARAVAGVWPIQGGAIRLDGAAHRQWDPNRLGKYVGYLPQDVELFGGTVAQNIARLENIRERMVIAAAIAAGVHEAILRLPNGYDTPIGESGLALSGGMRQRVALARALYGNPRLIILDEPNSNLDEEGEQALGRAIAGMKADGRTVVCVTHRPSLISCVDKLLVMSFGRALISGARDDVITKMRGQKIALAHDRMPDARAGGNTLVGAAST